MKRVVLFVVSSVLASFAVAMPSRSDLKKVQPTVNELMAEDIAAMKSGKQTSEGAAKRAEELAGMATDEASKFLLLKGAFGLYVEGGKYDEALAALETLKAQVKDVPDKVLADIVRAKMKKVSKKDGGAILSYYAQLDRRMRYAAEKAKLEKSVKANPSDKDAHRQLALVTAVLAGWPAALAEFVQAGGDVAAAAKAEQDGKVAAAADGWWACAGASGDEDVQEELKAHAAALYAQAIRDGKLDGLKKALAEKRVAEVGKETKEEVAEKPVRVEKTDAAEEAEKPQIAEKKYVPRVKTFDLGGKAKMEFIECPAGSFTMGMKWPGLPQTSLYYPHVVKFTRPFWMSKYPVTAGDVQALLGWNMLQNPIQNAIGPMMIANLSCEDMEEIAAKMTKRHRGKLPRGYVFRVPTEAEFEYAFRANNANDPNDYYEGYFRREPGAFYVKMKGWRENCIMTVKDLLELLKTRGVTGLPKIDDLPHQVLNCPNFGNNFSPVGQRRPNAWGFHDMMYGPVVTLDRVKKADGPWYANRYKDRKYEPEETDPVFVYSGPDAGPLRVGDVRASPACYKSLAKNGRGYMRLVLGPDLLKEKGLAK